MSIESPFRPYPNNSSNRQCYCHVLVSVNSAAQIVESILRENVKEKKRMAENVYCLAQALLQKDQVIKHIGAQIAS